MTDIEKPNKSLFAPPTIVPRMSTPEDEQNNISANNILTPDTQNTITNNSNKPMIITREIKSTNSQNNEQINKVNIPTSSNPQPTINESKQKDIISSLDKNVCEVENGEVVGWKIRSPEDKTHLRINGNVLDRETLQPTTSNSDRDPGIDHIRGNFTKSPEEIKNGVPKPKKRGNKRKNKNAPSNDIQPAPAVNTISKISDLSSPDASDQSLLDSPINYDAQSLISPDGKLNPIPEINPEQDKAERIRLEQERKAREEQERKAREEQERKAKEEQERKAKEEQDRKAKEEQERKAREEQERKAREEQERKAKEEQERKAERIRLEQERKAREEQDRKAKEEQERKAERIRLEQEQKAKEEQELLEQQRLEQQRLEQEQKAKEEQELLEQERRAKEHNDKEQKQRLKKEKQERLEQQRLEQQRLEQERLEQEWAKIEKAKRDLAERENEINTEIKGKYEQLVSEKQELDEYRASLRSEYEKIKTEQQSLKEGESLSQEVTERMEEIERERERLKVVEQQIKLDEKRIQENEKKIGEEREKMEQELLALAEEKSKSLVQENTEKIREELMAQFESKLQESIMKFNKSLNNTSNSTPLITESTVQIADAEEEKEDVDCLPSTPFNPRNSQNLDKEMIRKKHQQTDDEELFDELVGRPDYKNKKCLDFTFTVPHQPLVFNIPETFTTPTNVSNMYSVKPSTPEVELNVKRKAFKKQLRTPEGKYVDAIVAASGNNFKVIKILGPSLLTHEREVRIPNASNIKPQITSQPMPQMAQAQMAQAQMAQQMAQPQMAQPQMAQPQMTQPQMAQQVNGPSYQPFPSETSTKRPVDDIAEQRRIEEWRQMMMTHPRYENMSAPEKARYYSKFKLKFKTLVDNFPGLDIKMPSEDEDLHNIHARYDEYLAHIQAQESIGMWKFALSASWLAIEFVFTKLIGLNMTGFAKCELNKIYKYDTILQELGEKHYFSIGAGWPLWVRFMLITMMSALFFLVIQFITKLFPAARGMAEQMLDMMTNKLSNVGRAPNKNAPQNIGVDSDGIAEVPNKQQNPMGNMGDMSNMVVNFGTGLMNMFGGNNNNNTNTNTNNENVDNSNSNSNNENTGNAQTAEKPKRKGPKYKPV